MIVSTQQYQRSVKDKRVTIKFCRIFIIKQMRRVTIQSFFCVSSLLLCASAPVAFAQLPRVQTPADEVAHGSMIVLWPQGAPGAVGNEEQDKPHLEFFGASPETKSKDGRHTAVIVCPGGSYTSLAYDKEGTRIAEWLNLQGISAFVLSYRLTPRYQYPAPLLDGQRAIRWVRSHADEYGVAPDRIGIWGFSAGGHLVGMLGTHFDSGNASATDPVERVSDRADFAISAYGALTLDPTILKPELRVPPNALVSDQVLNELSPEKHVTAQTPPFFLYATGADARVPVLSSVVFYTALEKAGVPAELHIFEQGPHGTGLAQTYAALSEWPNLLTNWLRLHCWLPPQK
jgi:acetyl esterase/lipase